MRELLMRRLPEVTAYAGEPIRVTSPSGRLIGEITRAERDRPPQRGWRLDGCEVLYSTPTAAVMAALWRHQQERAKG